MSQRASMGAEEMELPPCSDQRSVRYSKLQLRFGALNMIS
jgi:hypothetical protein